MHLVYLANVRDVHDPEKATGSFSIGIADTSGKSKQIMRINNAYTVRIEPPFNKGGSVAYINFTSEQAENTGVGTTIIDFDADFNVASHYDLKARYYYWGAINGYVLLNDNEWSGSDGTQLFSLENGTFSSNPFTAYNAIFSANHTIYTLQKASFAKMTPSVLCSYTLDFTLSWCKNTALKYEYGSDIYAKFDENDTIALTINGNWDKVVGVQAAVQDESGVAAGVETINEAGSQTGHQIFLADGSSPWHALEQPYIHRYISRYCPDTGDYCSVTLSESDGVRTTDDIALLSGNSVLSVNRVCCHEDARPFSTLFSLWGK